MPTEGKRTAQTNRRRFLGCAAGALVYFGTASSNPIQWKLTRVSIQNDGVRVVVSRPARKSVQFDSRVYMFWAPLGERKGKGFTLHAYDETNRITVMTRHVVVNS